MADFKIEGLDQLKKTLSLLKGVDLSKIGMAGAFKLQQLAAPLVPVDTGALKNNVIVEPISGGASLTYAQEYAIYQELGTAKMKPQPYVRPTIDTKSDEIVKAMRDETWKEFEDKNG